MTHKTDRITEPYFNILKQIRQAGPERIAEPARVHAQVCAAIDQIARRSTEVGFSDRDADDIRYALVALGDETALQKGGALRDFWLQRMLQMQYYNENIAGEMFFDRLAEIRSDPERHQVLRVYYLCLLFGFQGKYRVRGGELALSDLQEQIKAELIRQASIETGQPLSPRAARPSEPVTDARRNALVLWLALGGAMASLLHFAFLRLRISQQAADLVERLTALIGGA